jgi:hypothetical protein
MMADAVSLAQRFAVDAVETLVTINAVFSIADDGLKAEDLMRRVEALEDLLEQQNENAGKQAYQNGAHRAPPRVG